MLNTRFLLALLNHVTCDYFWQYDLRWSHYWSCDKFDLAILPRSVQKENGRFQRLKTWNHTCHIYTKIIKMPTLPIYFSIFLSKLKRTLCQRTPDLYVLNWKSSYDVMLFMCQRRQKHFTEFWLVWFLDRGICKNTFVCSVLQ